MASSQSNKTGREIFEELSQLKQKDFNFSSGRILGSMCTVPHPIAREAYIRFLETNLGDPELCPGTKEVESRFLAFIGRLVHAPRSAAGQIVSGGTEGNITAMWLAKQLSGKREVLLPESAHFSFQKIASLMDMKLVEVPLTKEYTLDINTLKKKISSKTAAVVGLAGSTELGTVDPLPEISDLCADEQVFFHVDAAFGGFVIPFLRQLGYKVPPCDFTLKGVSTISLDSHKMGYAAISLGTLMIRQKQWLEHISVESPYISSEKQAGILGTRSGAPVAAAYAVTQYLGFDGYQNVVKSCMNVTQYTETRIKELGLGLVVEPTMNVLGVRLKKPGAVVKKLAENGWRVNKVERLSAVRMVLMPQITTQMIDEFIPVLKRVCEEVGEV
ncbi:MAG: tyrosine decarboxylase MfnA [Candidatus Thermoplasmatota archaeon]|nr:tyrosine decarboxylase MfnA [Candidatus Thermoplasmatota archaeon]